jgi:hypothetical protein
MRIIVYTPSKSDWYQKEADKVAKIFKKKIPEFEIDIVYRNIPKEAVTLVDSDGDTRPSWDWFTNTFPLPEDYDGVGVHLASFHYRRWDINGIRGSKNTINKDYPEFWFYAKRGEQAPGYEDLSQFARLLLHELSHFFEDLDDLYGDKLAQQSVHIADYNLKAIHMYPLLIDYRGYILKLQVSKIINRVINFARKIL